MLHFGGWFNSDATSGGLTADAVDHERVQLLLAMFALAREVWHGLDLSVKQIVQQCQCHFLCCAAVSGNVQHISWRHWAPYSHLWVAIISQPGAVWKILYMRQKKPKQNLRVSKAHLRYQGRQLETLQAALHRCQAQYNSHPHADIFHVIPQRPQVVDWWYEESFVTLVLWKGLRKLFTSVQNTKDMIKMVLI